MEAERKEKEEAQRQMKALQEEMKALREEMRALREQKDKQLDQLMEMVSRWGPASGGP